MSQNTSHTDSDRRVAQARAGKDHVTVRVGEAKGVCGNGKGSGVKYVVAAGLLTVGMQGNCGGGRGSDVARHYRVKHAVAAVLLTAGIEGSGCSGFATTVDIPSAPSALEITLTASNPVSRIRVPPLSEPSLKPARLRIALGFSAPALPRPRVGTGATPGVGACAVVGATSETATKAGAGSAAPVVVPAPAPAPVVIPIQPIIMPAQPPIILQPGRAKGRGSGKLSRTDAGIKGISSIA
ncbi:hypothetical protein B0H13DRAFT_1891837 [Mycena leptocephala]|nr:hypothetical protein B0H13DRAFT_1891837 [Mycena leptocephala]